MQHSVYHRICHLSLVLFWYIHLPNIICVWWEYSSDSRYIFHHNCCITSVYRKQNTVPLDSDWYFFVIAGKTQRRKRSYRNRKSQQSGSKNEKGIRRTTKWWYQLTTISERKVLITVIISLSCTSCWIQKKCLELTKINYIYSIS